MVDVFMKDGRTIFRLAERRTMVRLIQVDLFELADEVETTVVQAWANWQRDSFTPDWRPTKLLYLDRRAIAWVNEVDADQAEVFADAIAHQLETTFA